MSLNPKVVSVCGWILQVLWFSAIIVAACGVIVLVAVTIANQYFSVSWIPGAFIISAWLVLVPSLIWGTILGVLISRGKFISDNGHTRLAALMGLVSIPIFYLLIIVLGGIIREYWDPGFDDLGWFAYFGLIASLSFIIVFPILGYFVRKFSGALGISALFYKTTTVASQVEEND